MNKDLQEAIKIYSTGTHKELNAFLLDKSKDNLIAIFNDLLTTYINDKNSSTLREFITVSVAGYNHNEAKIGYNGYRQTTISSGEYEYCEVKPKNIDRADLEKYKNGEKKTIRKLDAGGNFTDYTWERFDKDLQANLNMLISGFVDGKLIYIFEFPFSNQDFTKKLKNQLEKAFPNRQRRTGTFLRSANFNFNDFIFSNNFKIVFLLSKEELKEYKEFFNGNFFQEIIKYAK